MDGTEAPCLEEPSSDWRRRWSIKKCLHRFCQYSESFTELILWINGNPKCPVHKRRSCVWLQTYPGPERYVCMVYGNEVEKRHWRERP